MAKIDELMEASARGDLEGVRALLDSSGELALACDASGATALHIAALQGRREVVELLVQRGADVNSRDKQFGATPAGWAIEYLRAVGGHLGIELDDLAFAIQHGDVRWVARILARFPALREASSSDGTTLRKLAHESGVAEIERLFDAS